MLENDNRYDSNTTKGGQMSQSKVETVEEFLARGGKITKCRTYDIGKYSSIPSYHKANNSGVNRAGVEQRYGSTKGISAQGLLDAAVGTEDEMAVIEFLESQGYEVE